MCTIPSAYGRMCMCGEWTFEIWGSGHEAAPTNTPPPPTSLCSDADFDAKPTVLLLGQYSVGKTSFIQYLIERGFPGSHVGAEPTTGGCRRHLSPCSSPPFLFLLPSSLIYLPPKDRFMAIMHGPSERTLPGNAVVVSNDKPFRALGQFGTQFLSKFEVSQCPSPVLENITLIDTPGVLSGEKQRVGHGRGSGVGWGGVGSDRCSAGVGCCSSC